MNELDESRMERKKKEVRQKIITVAIELFKSQGFQNTTMEQIAEAADVARKTLYNYFPVKEAIADAYVRTISRELALDVLKDLNNLPDTRSRLLTALNHAYSWVEINPEITGICMSYRFRTTYRESDSQAEETGTQQVIAEIFRIGQQTGEIRADLSIRMMVMYIDLLRGTMLMNWLKDSSQTNLSDEISKLVDLILYGACTTRRLPE